MLVPNPPSTQSCIIASRPTATLQQPDSREARLTRPEGNHLDVLTQKDEVHRADADALPNLIFTRDPVHRRCPHAQHALPRPRHTATVTGTLDRAALITTTADSSLAGDTGRVP